MRVKLWTGLTTFILLLALLVAMPLLSACGGGTDTTAPTTTAPTTTEPTTTQPAVAESDVVFDAVATYLTHTAPNIKASDLKLAIAEDTAPTIISLRSAADYANGHIPGAINMTFGELTSLDIDGSYLVYCYTGQSASFAAAMLGTLGYDVQNLLHGMSSWSDDPDVYVTRFEPDRDQSNFAVETEANMGGSYSLPVLDNTASNDPAEILLAAAQTVAPRYITATDLNMKIAEGEDMTIISCRSATDYANGHIPGAINIGLGSLIDNLSKINPDDPVYVYCYTGQSAAQETALLQMLGYDAYSLKFGMCSWSADPAVNAGKCFSADSVAGYAVE